MNHISYLFVDDREGTKTVEAANALRASFNGQAENYIVGHLNINGIDTLEAIQEREREAFHPSKNHATDLEKATMVHRYAERVKSIHKTINISERIITLRQGLGKTIRQTTGYDGPIDELSLPDNAYQDSRTLIQKIKETLE